MYTITLSDSGGCHVLGGLMPTKDRKHLSQTEDNISLLAKDCISPSLHHPFLHLPTEVSSFPSETSSLQLVWYPHTCTMEGCVAPAPSAPVAPMPLSVITGPLERLVSILSSTHMHTHTHALAQTCTHTLILFLALTLCRMSETQKSSREI